MYEIDFRVIFIFSTVSENMVAVRIFCDLKNGALTGLWKSGGGVGKTD